MSESQVSESELRTEKALLDQALEPQAREPQAREPQGQRELPRKPVGPVVYTETSGAPLFPDIRSW